MLRGNLSNVPAPLIYVDGFSLVEKKVWGWGVDLSYTEVLQKLWKDYTTVIWFPIIKFRKLKVGNKWMKPYMYNTIIYKKEEAFMFELAKKKRRVVSGRRILLEKYPNQTVDITLPFQKIWEKV